VTVPISMSFDLLIIFVLLFECSSDDPWISHRLNRLPKPET